MTVKELIKKLEESGDEKFKDSVQVRIIDKYGNVAAENLDMFDVKRGVNSVDIHTPI